jgi:hypothetical protein
MGYSEGFGKDHSGSWYSKSLSLDPVTAGAMYLKRKGEIALVKVHFERGRGYKEKKQMPYLLTPVVRSYASKEDASRLPPPPGRSTTNVGIMNPAMYYYNLSVREGREKERKRR